VFRRLVVGFLVVLVLLVVAADRVGAVVAAHVLASKIQTDEHLATRPDVTVGGFPFLTQVVKGRYSDVRVTSHDLDLKGVTVTTLAVQLHGAHISLGSAARDDVHQVPVDRADGQLTISYAAVDRYLASRHLRVTQGKNGQVAVAATVTVAGKAIGVVGTATATVSGNSVDVHVTQVGAVAGSHVAHLSLSQRVSFSLPLGRLPFRIDLGSVRATSAGIVATGVTHHLVLGSPTG
jgi:hypothetical protein